MVFLANYRETLLRKDPTKLAKWEGWQRHEDNLANILPEDRLSPGLIIRGQCNISDLISDAMVFNDLQWKTKAYGR